MTVESTTDIAIVGGGMVGACLALALRGGPHRVTLFEAARPQSVTGGKGDAGVAGAAGGAAADAAAPAATAGAADAAAAADDAAADSATVAAEAHARVHASFDDRTTALGNGARRVLDTLGLWQAIAVRAAPITRIHVSEAGRFGFARLDAASQGLEAFGYSVGNRHIGAVAWEALSAADDVGGHAAAGLTVLAPARVTQVRVEADGVVLTWTDAAGVARELSARLVVAADGAQSLVKQAAGIGSQSTSYEQVAVIANLRTDRPAEGIAYERFTDTGPMAMLPLFDGSYTAVWALAPGVAAEVMQYDDAQFCARLQQRFGWRAGRFMAAGRRAAYPLALTRAQAPAAARTVVVGNAAQMLHPVAAQGFNLGLRDAALLAELLMDAPDPGDAALLAEFGRRRAADRDGMVRFTDTLVKLFDDPRPGARVLRDIGLLLFDVTPPAKQALSRLSWGFGTGLPRLVRGLPLR